MKRTLFGLLGLILIYSCTPSETSNISGKFEIDTLAVANHLKTLSSDAFEGRKPFSPGEEKTVNYLKEQFEKIGLEPGNGGSYFQDVPMVQITGSPDETMKISGGSSPVSLSANKEYVAYTDRPVESVSLDNSEMVFAGYGVVAPEYGWNDYEGLDVKGKTVIVLVNDPGFGSGDSTLFKGEQMTYYGRWTYKYEEAARQGAAGCLIIHETVPAGYPWLVVSNSWSGGRLTLDGDPGNLCAVQGWITRDAAIKLFETSGEDLKNFREMARNKDFQPISLGLNTSIGIINTIERNVSKNVIAQIQGTEKPDEAIIYSAHWDHLGIGTPIDGDSIYNGALDNASGTAVLLGLAQAFANKEIMPRRTVVFLAVTAEEQGLYGSQYYAENPTFDPQKIVANINMDGASYYGKMKDLTVIGYGQSEMDDLAASVAETQDRYIIPDPDAGKGYFYRSDHFNFAKIGVPALYAGADYEAVDGGVDAIQALKDAYLTGRYHRPQDEFGAVNWQYGGLYQDAMLYLTIGDQLANSNIFPKWKEGSEFKSIRESK